MRLSFFIGIAAIAGVAGLALHSSSQGQTRLGPFTGEALNPEKYRGSIVQIDAVLFEDGPLDESGRTQASDALLALGRLTVIDTTNTIAVTLGQNARMLSSMVRHTSLGTPLAGSMPRKEWTRIRGSLFDDAAWFRRSAADPVEPAEAGPPPPSTLLPASPEARRDLETALFSLTLLIESARRDLPNLKDSDAHRIYVSDTERELAIDIARVRLPLPPMVGVDNYYLRTRDHTEGAMAAVRTVMMLDPGNPRREQWLASAEEQLAKAKKMMEQMMR
jgi:hypothetical protein